MSIEIEVNNCLLYDFSFKNENFATFTFVVKDMFNLLRHLRTFSQVLFVCFVALRLKSTAMVMAGRSVHLTTLFSWASLNKQLTSTSCTYFRL